MTEGIAMTDIVVYTVVFGLAGAFFLWLRRMGRRSQARTAAGAVETPDGGDEHAENLGFAAEAAARLAQRGARQTDRREDGEADGGGGD
jgi:hypothetical protein